MAFIAIFYFTANSFLLNLSNNIDRWAVHLIFSVATLGTYAFALNFASLGHMVLNMIQLYAGPRMLNKFGRTKNFHHFVTVQKNCNIHSFIFGLGSIPTFILFPLVVETWSRIRFFYRVVQISLCWGMLQHWVSDNFQRLERVSH